MSTQPDDLDTSQIKNWKSIITLVVFVLTNLALLDPFHITVFIPRFLSNAVFDSLNALRITPGSPRRNRCYCTNHDHKHAFVRFKFPMNFVTAPLIADLFLLAISAIGQKEVYDSTVGLGADSFSPIDIIAFFISLAYITISIAASGLIQYLAFRVLQWGDNVGRRLFFYLYAFLFGLGAVMGGDAVVLSSTAFLAYFTRISSNIIHPGAWIHTQFAIARISSAILVSSNPTNLILASAFNIKFIHYTANIIVPVVVTALMLLLFLLYVRFADPNLIPHSIKMQELTEEEKAEKPLNPNIPDARGADEGPERAIILSMKEILNPFLDKTAAAFGAVIVTATLVTILALNTQSTSQYPVYWVTLPAAFVMFCWDITFGWRHRHKTREIARKGREEIERFQAERHLKVEQETRVARQATPEPEERHTRDFVLENDDDLILSSNRPSDDMDENEEIEEDNKEKMAHEEPGMELWEMQTGEVAHREQLSREVALQVGRRKGREQTRRTIVHLKMDIYRWSRETFPTATAVLTHLPFSLVPFIFSMFVLVQALVTRRWVLVFAYGWDHWVNKTGTVGAVGGMGFLSVILCNLTPRAMLYTVAQKFRSEMGIPLCW